MCKQRDILKQSNRQHKSPQENSLIKEFWKMRVITALDDVLKEDADYQLINKQSHENALKIDALGLDASQLNIIYSALSACHERSVAYGRVAYNLGVNDATDYFKDFFDGST